MLPLLAGLSLDSYLIGRLILPGRTFPALIAGTVALALAALWFGLPALGRRRKA
jgi:hypothetical protein